MYFHRTSPFHDQRSYFTTHTSLCIILYKIHVRNMWGKLINCLLKMKRTESNYSWKRVLLLYKRAPLFGNGHLDNPEGQVEVESTLIGSRLWHFEKSFFNKKGTFQRSVRSPDALSFWNRSCQIKNEMSYTSRFDIEHC